MKFGLQTHEFEYIQKKVVAPLTKLNFVVYCFGSRARGTHSPFSDLDLMIEGTKSNEADQLKSQIEEDLSKENFPFKVDLVFFEDYASAYKDGYLKDRKLWSIQ